MKDDSWIAWLILMIIVPAGLIYSSICSESSTMSERIAEQPKVVYETRYIPIVVTPTSAPITLKSVNVSKSVSRVVYRTRTGSKYHRAGCRYLKSSCYEITEDEAWDYGLTPCSVCNP